ncbi:MAG TPA: histidinol-phosphate transaminase [Candidatus Acidoferrales bacterium]|nr:histidinol-phosphate transaminase [Candidatus Acidoferrales bacterium]
MSKSKWSQQWWNAPSTYTPGKSAEDVAREYGISPERIIKLGSNENALGPSPKAVEAIKRHLSELSVYPAPKYLELKTAIARYLGASVERIVVGNGSDDVLNTIIRCLLVPGDEAIIPVPTYSYYEVIVESGHGACVYVPRDDGFSIDIQRTTSAITNKTKFIFVCAPNNPTGNAIEKAELRRLLESTTAVILLDEAYAEFASESHIELVNEFENLVVFRTFSKAFGLAGLRLGYAVLNEELGRCYDKLMLSFSVNHLAVKGGIAALSDRGFLERTVSMVAQGREFLRKNIPLKTFPSEGNFIFVDTSPYDSRELFDYLLREGIIVRNCDTFRGCSNTHVRITVGQPWQNAAVVDAIKEFVTT